MANVQPQKERPTFSPDPHTERSRAPGFVVEQAPVEAQPQTQVEQEPEREQREYQSKQEQSPGQLEQPTLRKFLPKKKKQQHIIPQVRDELTREVETIMEEGLADAYKELSPLEQQEFKIKGEQTAIEIRNMLRSAHVRVKSIFKLLLEWLKLLPGVNRFFLEQEAKIKAERILSLRRKGR